MLDKTWLDAGLAFFYPPVCQICGGERAAAADGYVCGPCWERDGGLQWIVPPFCERCGLPHEGAITTTYECSNCRALGLEFSSARAAVAAQGLVLEIIHRYKYQRALWFEPFLVKVLLRAAAPWFEHARWDFIVPIPLHPVKQREREFNQALRLGRKLGAATSLPVRPEILRRHRATRTQTKLTRAQRSQNVQQAFTVDQPTALAGARIVLVDDVMTTGATASACAHCLLQAGASEVCVWTVARATFHPEFIHPSA